MEWEVTVKFGSIESVYKVTAPRYHEARIEGLTLFLRENKIPGRPWEYLSSKKGMIEVKVRSLVDKRREPRQPMSVQYYLEQIARLRKMIREDSLSPNIKKEAVRLLIKLGEVLSGKS